MHHQYSDEQPDPHSPLVTFVWGHLGWLFVENREVNTMASYDRYARDVLRDPFYLCAGTQLGLGVDLPGPMGRVLSGRVR